MNERIRELSDIAYKNHLARNPHSSYGRRSDYDREFAELIVEECAKLMKKESEEYYNVGSDYCDHKAEAFDEAVDLVKKHFGVEE